VLENNIVIYWSNNTYIFGRDKNMRKLFILVTLLAIMVTAQAASILVYDTGASLLSLMSKTGLVYDVANATQFAALTLTQLQSYEVIVTGGWNGTFTGMINNPVWKSAINGRVILDAKDPEWHQPAAAVPLMQNMINWVKDGPGTGFISLTDNTGAFWNWTPWVGTGTVTANHADDVNIISAYASHPIHTGLTSASLSGWGNSYHAVFNTLPTGFVAIEQNNAGQAITVIKDVPVPEPSSMALLALGIGLLAIYRKQK